MELGYTDQYVGRDRSGPPTNPATAGSHASRFSSDIACAVSLRAAEGELVALSSGGGVGRRRRAELQMEPVALERIADARQYDERHTAALALETELLPTAVHAPVHRRWNARLRSERDLE